MTKEKEEPLEVEGTVVEAVKGGFQVQVENMAHTVLCRLGGKLRKHFIRVVPGDKVTVEMSPYDLTKGRITFRHK